MRSLLRRMVGDWLMAATLEWSSLSEKFSLLEKMLGELLEKWREGSEIGV